MSVTAECQTETGCVTEGEIKGILVSFWHAWMTTYLILIKTKIAVYASTSFYFRCKTTMESIHGLMSQVIKDRLFNQVHLTQ